MINLMLLFLSPSFSCYRIQCYRLLAYLKFTSAVNTTPNGAYCHLVNKDGGVGPVVLRDELSGVVSLAGLNTAQIPGESLLTPRNLRWIADGSES